MPLTLPLAATAAAADAGEMEEQDDTAALLRYEMASLRKQLAQQVSTGPCAYRW